MYCIFWLGLLVHVSLLISHCKCCCILPLWLLHVLLHLLVQLLCVLCYFQWRAEDVGPIGVAAL